MRAARAVILGFNGTLTVDEAVLILTRHPASTAARQRVTPGTGRPS
jgi:hypothetical protein